MPSNRARVFAFWSFALFALSSAHAQNTNVTNDQATPIPGVGHDYVKMLNETVNPANGSVSLRIDMSAPKARKLSIPYAWLYSSAGRAIPGTKWSDSSPLMTAIQGAITTFNPSPYPQTYTCEYISNYMLQDLAGTRHALNISIAQVGNGGTSNCNLVSGRPTNYLTGGDGIFNAITTAPGDGQTNFIPSPVTLSDADGTVYYFPWNSVLGGFISTPSYIKDRNGNILQWTTSGGNTVITDDAGRSAVTISPYPPFTSSTSSTVNVSGLSNPFAFHWANAAYNYSPNYTLVYVNGSCPTIANSVAHSNNIQTLTLPNGQAYSFQYDSASGNLSRITYPNGGYISYTWGVNPQSESSVLPNSDNQQNSCIFRYDLPVITHRYVSFDGVNIASQQDFSYSMNWVSSSSSLWSTKQTTVVTKDCARNNFNCSTAPSFTTIYNYSPIVVPPAPNVSGGGGQAAVERTVIYKDWTGSTLRTVTKGWVDQYRLGCELTTLDNGLISGAFYIRGFGGDLKNEKDFDYGLITSTSACPTGASSSVPPSGVTPSREIDITNQAFPNTPIFPSGPSIFDRPCKVLTYGNGTLVAESDNLYDGQTGTTPCSAAVNQTLPGAGNYAGHDETLYGTSASVPRGNLTKIIRKCLQSCTDSTTTLTYDETGQVLSMTDACGNATCADMTGSGHTTTYSYADNFDSPPASSTNAYLTSVTDPLGHVSTYKYAFSDGQLLSATDPNNQVTSYLYADPLRRRTEVDYPDGGKTTIAYNDATYNASTPSPSVTTTKLASPSPNITTLTAFDGLGHTVRSVLTSDSDCATGDRTDTTYDGLGRVYRVSNPYCTTGDATYGLSTNTYDAIGRITQSAHPDATTVLTTYTGRATQVQDEGNGTQRVTRVSQIDGLGRLTSVCEASSTTLVGQNAAPAGCGQDIAQTGFLTSYLYDGLSNLKQVNQGSMAPRTFAYDSLSRLTSATNPESGAITYTYDVNGNLATKKDARNITTTYAYDTLNRNTQKSYSDGTPTATFVYDSSTAPNGWHVNNPVGRLVQATAGSAFTINSYDSVGRIAGQGQQIPRSYPTSSLNYTYDLAGNMLSSTNGEFQTFTYTYNGGGRLTSLTSSLSDSQHPPNLLSAVHYNAFGALTSDTLGNGDTEAWTYNDTRGRLTSYVVKQAATTLYTLTIPNGGYAANSNIVAANDSANGNWTYTYDPFNRLIGSNKGGGSAVFSYVYDRFGNRWQQNGPNSFIATFTGNNPGNPQNNNRIDGYSYDAAGNLLSDGVHSYTYDAENRITKVDNGSTATYVYDGLGRRVQKTTATITNNECGTSGTGTVFYLYDLSGHTVVYTPNGVNSCTDDVFAAGRHLATYSGGTIFNHSDWLGTERMRTSYTGAVCETIASLAFGDGQTTTGGCYHPSPLHFTGKLRDPESGLDNFGARYDASSLGRFTSPDPQNLITVVHGMKAGGLPEAAANNFLLGFLEDPQNWNKYTYGLNNPLRFVDPTGAAPQDGHHLIVERSNLNLGDIGKDFANKIKTGPLSGNGFPNQPGFNTVHREYNEAVKQLLNKAVEEEGQTEGWSVQQWKNFANSVLNSEEPAIQNFLEELEENNPGAKAALATSVATYTPSASVIARLALQSFVSRVGMLRGLFILCFDCNHIPQPDVKWRFLRPPA